MEFLLSLTTSCWKTFNSLSNKVCIPRYNDESNKVEREISLGRNKAIFLVEVIFIFISIINDLLSNQKFTFEGIAAILSCGVIILMLFISNMLHPQIFKIFCNCISFLYPPLLLKLVKGDVIFHFLAGAQTFPIFVYCFTGSTMHLAIQGLFQLFYLSHLYYSHLQTAMVEMPLPVFCDKFTQAAGVGIILNLVFMILIHHHMRNAYEQALKAQKEKEESDKQKIFLLGFSHELRNLLNSLIGNLKLAGLEILTDKLKDFILNAEVCGELLLHLVNNILDSGKVEVGDLEINPLPANVYEMMERAWGVISELVKRRGLHGRVRIRKDTPKSLLIDHYRLTQVLLNLVGNAVKFTDTGYIDINVEWIPNVGELKESCFQPYPLDGEFDDNNEGIFEKNQKLAILEQDIMIIDLSSRKFNRSELMYNNNKNKGILKIVVSDTGCGIAKNEIPKLFQKFSQVSSDNSKRRLGTGLGLFITKELCNRMGGEIKVFSKPGKGSSFMVCLPVEPVFEERSRSRMSSIITRDLGQKNQKALIVDDDRFNGMITKQFFHKLGIEDTQVAVNGMDGYSNFINNVCGGKSFDIVTMDIEMPVMDGKTAAQKLREYEQRNDLKPCVLIMISGNCSESEIKECINKEGKIRANAFLKKPVAIENLVSVINR